MFVTWPIDIMAKAVVVMRRGVNKRKRNISRFIVGLLIGFLGERGLFWLWFWPGGDA